MEIRLFFLQVETNNAKGMTSRKFLDKLLQIKTALLNFNESYKLTLLHAITRVDDSKTCLTILKLNDLLEELNLPIVKNRNITVGHLERKGLHFNPNGIERFQVNLKASIVV